MKKIITLLSATIFAFQLIAQAPQAISYQTVIRNANNNLLVNTLVSIKISIISGVNTVYAETHTKSTNENGLVSLSIGKGNVVSGIFSTIDWGTGTYFVKTDIDPSGGSNYTITGGSQFLSVPYAFHSATTSDESTWLKNNDNLFYSKGNIGVKNSNPKFPLHVNGNIYIGKPDGKLILGNNPIGDTIFSPYIQYSTLELLINAKNNDIALKGREVNVYNSFGNRTVTISNNGKMGIGTVVPRQLLSVNDTIESMKGGFKFPDGSIQATAATSSPWKDNGSTISYSGNVGIGVLNPLAKLELDGDIKFAFPGQGLIFNQNGISIKSSMTGNGLELNANKMTFKALNPIPSNFTPFEFLTNSPVMIKDYNGITKMTFDPFTGNTGLGTQIPARTLHVNDVMRLEPRSSAPTSPSKGDIYFDDTLNKLRVFDGTTWQSCW